MASPVVLLCFRGARLATGSSRSARRPAANDCRTRSSAQLSAALSEGDMARVRASVERLGTPNAEHVRAPLLRRRLRTPQPPRRTP
jgi:hypothetical protein